MLQRRRSRTASTTRAAQERDLQRRAPRPAPPENEPDEVPA